jgi:hypothetical protein
MSTPRIPRPAVSPSSSSLQVTPVPEAEDRVTGLFSLEGASDALALNRFDQEELITSLIADTRSEDPDIRIRGRAQFWAIMKDIAAANGRFTKQQATTEGTTNGKVVLTQSRTVLSPPGGRFGSGAFAAPAVHPSAVPVARVDAEPDHAPEPPVP